MADETTAAPQGFTSLEVAEALAALGAQTRRPRRTTRVPLGLGADSDALARGLDVTVIDASRDGIVSARELIRHVVALMAVADANSDGEVTRAELTALSRESRPAGMNEPRHPPR